jgi:hypothetical protein
MTLPAVPIISEPAVLAVAPVLELAPAPWPFLLSSPTEEAEHAHAAANETAPKTIKGFMVGPRSKHQSERLQETLQKLPPTRTRRAGLGRAGSPCAANHVMHAREESIMAPALFPDLRFDA